MRNLMKRNKPLVMQCVPSQQSCSFCLKSRIPNLKVFYKKAIRSAMVYCTECCGVKKQYGKKNVVEIRMPCSMCRHTRNDRIKMRENRLRWFGHVNRRPMDAPIRRCDYETKAQGKRGRERSKETFKETIIKNIEYFELTEDFEPNRAWRFRIHSGIKLDCCYSISINKWFILQSNNSKLISLYRKPPKNSCVNSWVNEREFLHI